jgi:hypothetical protein
MEKLVLTIIEERNTFIEALRYLNFLKVNEITDNEDIMHYVDQMLNPDNREEVFDDIENEHFFVADIEFRDELNAQIICSFWNAVCADAREKFPEIYEMAFKMYYGLVMALEVAKEEGDVL